MELIYLGLRSAVGLDLNHLPSPEGRQVIDGWLENGSAHHINNRLVLTWDGMVIADRLAGQLITLI